LNIFTILEQKLEYFLVLSELNFIDLIDLKLFLNPLIFILS